MRRRSRGRKRTEFGAGDEQEAHSDGGRSVGRGGKGRGVEGEGNGRAEKGRRIL